MVREHLLWGALLAVTPSAALGSEKYELDLDPVHTQLTIAEVARWSALGGAGLLLISTALLAGPCSSANDEAACTTARVLGFPGIAGLWGGSIAMGAASLVAASKARDLGIDATSGRGIAGVALLSSSVAIIGGMSAVAVAAPDEAVIFGVMIPGSLLFAASYIAGTVLSDGQRRSVYRDIEEHELVDESPSVKWTIAAGPTGVALDLRF